MRITWVVLTAMAILIAACANDSTDTGLGVESQALTADQEAGLLALLNDQNTTFERLDVACGIRSDSARKIIKYRDGKDKLPGTADDNLFDSLEEIEAVVMVGQWTIDRLFSCAGSFGYLPPDDSCQPEPYDESYDGAYDLVWVSDTADLEPTLASLVDDFYLDAQQYRDTDIIFPMEFSSVEIYTDDNGVPVVYEVVFRQWLDPECGVLLYVVYTLDSCYNLVDFRVLV